MLETVIYNIRTKYYIIHLHRSGRDFSLFMYFKMYICSKIYYSKFSYCILQSRYATRTPTSPENKNVLVNNLMKKSRKTDKYSI